MICMKSPGSSHDSSSWDLTEEGPKFERKRPVDVRTRRAFWVALDDAYGAGFNKPRPEKLHLPRCRKNQPISQLSPRQPANNTRRAKSNRTRHPTVAATSPSTPAQTPQTHMAARTQAPRSVSTVPETESPPKTDPTHPERASTEQDPLSQRSASSRQLVPPVLPNDPSATPQTRVSTPSVPPVLAQTTP